MKKIYYFIFISVFYFTCNDDPIKMSEYYIPKPKAFIKVSLPSAETTLFDGEYFTCYYSNSSWIKINQKNSFSIIYPEYKSNINFSIKNLEDLDLEIYNFENSISIHEKQGALINANIVENPESNIYGILCYLEGNKIATSAQFFLTDSLNYFVAGGLEFSSSINSEIAPKNNIMKSEIFNFISSFRWAEIDE